MMDKYHEIDKGASEVCGSYHDGECCGNCGEWECCDFRFDFAVNDFHWCILWSNILDGAYDGKTNR